MGLPGAARHAWPAATGLALGLLALGPALAPGYVLSYDMVFVPGPPLDAADLGLSGGPPRAVPSDLVVALAARIAPADAVQKVILLAIFALACTGAAALLEAGWRARAPGGPAAARAGPPLLARLAAGACYTWNPFVAERLIMGQWALLLGYAGLPWVLREVSCRAGPARPGRLALAALPAAVGGFAAMSITALAAVPAALARPPASPVAAGPGGDRRSGRAGRLAATLAVLGALSLPWLIPALAVPVRSDPAGATAFAARADTPFGTAGSLLMLGGIWNAQAVPAGYGGAVAGTCWLAVVLLALGGYLLAARRGRACPGLGAGAAVGAGAAALGLTGPSLTALRAAIAFWPGFALLRDGQQFVAPLALAEAIGLGADVAALVGWAGAAGAGERRAGAGRPGRGPGGPAVALGVLALLAPVLLLPGLAWGAFGRLRAVGYPADWLRARQLIQADPRPGSVLLLPWAQYRRYPWNHGEAVYDPWPRFTSRPVIWNDALTVGRVTVAAEDAGAMRLGPLVTSGRPMTGPLRAAGVRYVVVDSGPLLARRGEPPARLAALAGLPGARVELDGPDLLLFLLPPRHVAAGPACRHAARRGTVAGAGAENYDFLTLWGDGGVVPDQGGSSCRDWCCS